MARRVKNRGGSNSSRRSFLSDPEIARMLQQMRAEISGTGSKPAPQQSVSSELLEEWQDAIGGLISGHAVDKRRRGERVKGSLELKSVKREVGCDVVLKCGASTYRASWSFDLEGRTFSASCNCGHQDLCEHTYFMAMKLKDLLNNPRSELVTKIAGEDLAERNLKQTFSLLQSLTRNAQMSLPKIEDAAAVEKPLTRFVWDVTVDHYYKTVHLKPCLQQEKKNGGWTKGKETTLEAFLKSSREQWTAIDQQLAELVKQERWQTPTLELADALRVLAGSDQFTFDRDPCELESHPLEIVVLEVEGGLRLSTSATDLLAAQTEGTQTLIVDAKRGVLVVLQERRRAIYFSGPPHSNDICNHLSKQTAIIPLEKKAALLKELEPLRSCMAVRLPESIAGQDVPYDGQMTLVLQLRRNGMLDASIQVQDRNQMLQSPGEGLARIHETVDEKPVQYVRNLADEVRRARELANELKLKRGVPISRCGWRISDADDISNLLSDAGVAVERGELVVLWHKDSVSRFDVIGRLTASNVRVTVSRQRDWFGLTGTCKIGDHEIPLKDLLAGMHGRPTNGLMEISPGKWAAVAEELRNALRRLSDVSLESRGKLQLDASAIPVISALESASIQVDADKHWDKCLKRLREATDTIYEPPAGLNAQLRDYQVEGFRWLCRLAHWGIGGILADDMGLGKQCRLSRCC